MTVRVSHNETTSPLQLCSTVRTANLLDCSTRTVYRLAAAGELVPVRVGRVLRFELAEIERYLARNREPAP
jgi:excisionase family DNA binding protein